MASMHPEVAESTQFEVKMGMFFWLKNSDKIDAFARSAADELYSHVNPEEAAKFFSGTNEQQKKKRQQNVATRMNGTILQMHDFSQQQSLGVYGKARLHKRFSDRLIELGYDAQSTRQLVRAILYRKLI